eukprot:15462636-Alexandrium_andersonii.AAC.1
MKLPHECLEEEFRRDESLLEKVENIQSSMPPAFAEHPVVQGGGLVMPVGIYADGVPYSQVDSLIGFWLFNIATGSRFLFAFYAKSTCANADARAGAAFSRSSASSHGP